jgi:hypothetical protein
MRFFGPFVQVLTPLVILPHQRVGIKQLPPPKHCNRTTVAFILRQALR